jgi:hypothetical protein
VVGCEVAGTLCGSGEEVGRVCAGGVNPAASSITSPQEPFRRWVTEDHGVGRYGTQTRDQLESTSRVPVRYPSPSIGTCSRHHQGT